SGTSREELWRARVSVAVQRVPGLQGKLAVNPDHSDGAGDRININQYNSPKICSDGFNQNLVGGNHHDHKCIVVGSRRGDQVLDLSGTYVQLAQRQLHGGREGIAHHKQDVAAGTPISSLQLEHATE